jgi:hypothetical protein
MSNDVNRFQYICLDLQYVFIAPIQTIIVLYLSFATVNPFVMVCEYTKLIQKGYFFSVRRKNYVCFIDLKLQIRLTRMTEYTG